MRIDRVYLENFRNYAAQTVTFHPACNVICGENAQGKTNLLEALCCLSCAKSHRTRTDKELIRFGAEGFVLQGEIFSREREFVSRLEVRRGRRKAMSVNKVPAKTASALSAVLGTIFFSPEDLGIIKNGPAERRRFVDMELCQLDSLYLYNLNHYNRIVNQRNKLLKDMYMNPDLKETLGVWDMQLASFGSKIIQRRKLFGEQLNEIIYGIHRKLSGDREELAVHYEPDVEAEDFEEKLRANQDRDIRAKMTSVGPHRDDFSFIIGDIDIRRFGSQGQQRTAALSLKLSEIELVKKIAKDAPILLLDDVLSELDSNRQNYLLGSIGDIQTIITCTGLDEFVKNRFEINKVFKVVNGMIDIS